MAERNHSLDWLKAGAIIGVVLWHGQPVVIDESASTGGLAIVMKTLFYALSYHVALLAVPLFLAVSLYLFADRVAVRGLPYLVVRLRRLATVFAFWLGVQWLLHLIVDGEFAVPTFRLVAQGGPPIAESGSVLYFLFVLIVLTVISYLYECLPAPVRRVAGIAIVVASFTYFEYMGLTGRSIPLQSLANFGVLVPLVSFVRSSRLTPTTVTRILISGWLAMTLHDIGLRALSFRGASLYHANDYGRVSMVLGAAALLSYGLAHPAPQGAVSSILSRYSLGIFAVHKNVIALLAVALPVSGMIGVAGVQLDVFPAARLLLACVVTALVVWVLDRVGVSFAVS